MATIDHRTLSELLLSDNVMFELLAAWDDIACAVPELGALAMPPLVGASHKDNVAHTIAVTAKTPPRLRVRLLALFHDVGKPPTRAQVGSKVTFHNHEAAGGRLTTNALARLGFDADLCAEVAKLVTISGATKGAGDWTDSAVRRLLTDAGDLLEDLLDFATVDVTSKHERNHELVRAETSLLRERIDAVRRDALARQWRPVVSGDDIMARYGLTPSREVGRLLAAVAAAQRSAEARDDDYDAARAWVLLDETRARG